MVNSLQFRMLFLTLSKILPLLVYPLGLACILLLVTLLRKRSDQWARRLPLLALMLLWVGGNRWLANTLTRSLEWQYLPPESLPRAEVIVLLGGSARSQLAPRPLPEVNEAGDRIIYAAWLYHQGSADKILVSSGRAVTSVQTGPGEAESIVQLLQMLGVPEEAIWEENKSRNTYENALYSKEILAEQGIDRILLVTSAMHMPRTVRIFQKQGFEVMPMPTDYLLTVADWEHQFQGGPAILLLNALPQAGALHLTQIALKEYIGIAVYWMRGWL